MNQLTKKLLSTIAAVLTVALVVLTARRQENYGTSVKLERPVSKENIPIKMIPGLETPFRRALRALQRQLDGSVLTPASQRYTEVLSGSRAYSFPPFNMPNIVVEAASCRDIARAIKFAKTHNLKFRVRSGGHSYAGTSTCVGKCLVVTTRLLRRVEHNPQKKIWRFGAGATVKAVARANAFSHGICSAVAMGGHIQGGGIGSGFRKFGLLTDHMVGAFVMLANGKVVHATRKNKYADLLWAIRGSGGGNWGVLLAYELKQTFDLASDFWFHTPTFVYPFEPNRVSFRAQFRKMLEDGEAVLMEPDVDPEYEAYPYIFIVPNRKHVMEGVKTSYTLGQTSTWSIPRRNSGKSVARMNKYLKRPQKTSVKISHHVFPTWEKMNDLFWFPLANSLNHLPVVVRTRVTFKSLAKNDKFLDAMTEMFFKWKDNTDVYMGVQIYPIGKSQFMDHATSYSLRDSLMTVDMSITPRNNLGKALGWEMVADFERIIAPTLSNRQYMNSLTSDDAWAQESVETRLYGGVDSRLYKKLQKIKRKYDPTNFFHFPTSVSSCGKDAGSVASEDSHLMDGHHSDGNCRVLSESICSM